MDLLIPNGLGIAWAVALVVLLVARLAGAEIRDWWLAMCVAGALLGVLGVRFCQRRQAAIARDRGAAGPTD